MRPKAVGIRGYWAGVTTQVGLDCASRLQAAFESVAHHKPVGIHEGNVEISSGHRHQHMTAEPNSTDSDGIVDLGAVQAYHPVVEAQWHPVSEVEAKFASEKCAAGRIVLCCCHAQIIHFFSGKAGVESHVKLPPAPDTAPT